jgi:hypothetical protein
LADFYSSYSAYKNYQPASLGGKDIKRFDAEIWRPAGFTPDMKCLELGCGTGGFLEYLAHKKVRDFRGLDHDHALTGVLRPEIRDRFTCQDIGAFLNEDKGAPWDRAGKIVIRVPNGSSPWGMSYQYGDLTHKTAFNPESLRQLATACDLQIDRVYDQRRGSRRRRLTDALVCKLLSWTLLTPPALWGANLYCILRLK